MRKLTSRDRYVTYDFLSGSNKLGLIWPDYAIARITRETIYYAGLRESNDSIYLDSGAKYASIIDYDASTDSLYVVSASQLRLPYVIIVRLLKSAKLTEAYIIYLLSIWGIANQPEYTYPSWKNIRIVNKIYKTIARERGRRKEETA